MEIGLEKRELAKKLQAKINAMQRLGKLSGEVVKTGLQPFAAAFPDSIFPTGSIHEFLSNEPADAASTSGFMTALAGKFIKEGGLCLWVGSEIKIFPPGIKHFGFDPDRIVFIRASKPSDILWIVEEALKCEALAAVIGEVKSLSFTESRRLQLASEQSGVTGFIHRYQAYGETTTACIARWKITPLPGLADNDVPGVGYSCWDVQLLKIKNGKPNSWQISWTGKSFAPIYEKRFSIPPIQERHAG